MRLSTQMHRFLISTAVLGTFAALIALQPRVAAELGDEVLAESPMIIFIQKAPTPAPSSSWRQMLPATFSPRRS